METTGLCRTNQHQLFSCLCIALVIALPWIHVRDSLGIWDVSMGLELQHLARHVMAELLNFFLMYLKNSSLDHLPIIMMV